MSENTRRRKHLQNTETNKRRSDFFNHGFKTAFFLRYFLCMTFYLRTYFSQSIASSQVNDINSILRLFRHFCLLEFSVTVEALLTDTLVSGQLYLRPPCLKTRFHSNTNSVFLHSRKRTFL